jgi:AmmeMemoRadiSam system protein A
MLTEAESRQLLRIARKSIEERLKNNRRYDARLDSEFSGFTPEMESPCGAFVTLEKHEDLRGCIGLIEGERPLYEAIQEMAVSAAIYDPRFPPVMLSELPELHLEISVLTPLKEIESLKEVEIGKHGVYITKGMNRGLLLPQVATDHNWGLEEFLRNTCYKAGLNPDAWKRHRRDPEMHIYIFSAQIFGCAFTEA